MGSAAARRARNERGLTTFEGQMVDGPTFRQAERVLWLARRCLERGVTFQLRKAVGRRLLTGAAERLASAPPEAWAQLRSLIEFQVDCVLEDPGVDLAGLPLPDAAQVPWPLRRYVEVWATSLGRVHSRADEETGLVHAVLGLIGSVRHAAGHMDHKATTALLGEMAWVAATV